MQFIFNEITFNTQTESNIKSQSIEQIQEGDVSIYKLKIAFDGKLMPKPFIIKWNVPQIDILGFWSSGSFHQHNITPDWYARKIDSKSASGMPLACLYNKANKNKLSVALSDPASPSAISAGVVEEDGTIIMQIDLFSKPSLYIDTYEVEIYLDKREINLASAIRDARTYLTKKGYECAYVPSSAKDPVYSAWYSFHQNTYPDQILKECEIAKEYGIKTLIVDDGWQTDDSSRGYAFCGDWKIATSKIPDMKDFVDKVHALGMKFMIWFSVPFVGFQSENYERFKGMYLGTRKWQGTSVLDPRFKEVREFLVQTYVSYVEKYGWDGLKLDFIDSFVLTDESSTDYDKMDTTSLEVGVERLLCEISDKLKEINPEFLIEFRQSYIGPVMAKYGNFFRVGDCPNDPIANRICSLDLRLTSDKIPVHSDMLMWNKNDTVEAVMYQLLAVMFSVPQISIRFDSITDDHKRALKSYLDFWTKHRDTLLDGELEVYGIDADYTHAKAKKDGESVQVLYQSVVAKIDKNHANYIFNSTGSDEIYIESPCGLKCEVYNIYGSKLSEGIIASPFEKIKVPNCGMIKIY